MPADWIVVVAVVAAAAATVANTSVAMNFIEKHSHLSIN